MTQALFRLCLSLALCALLALPAQAQSGIQIQTDEATQDFPNSIRFHLVASSGAAIDSVILHYGTNGRTCQSGEVRQSVDFDHGATADAGWQLEFKRSGSFPPGVQVWWQWEVHDASGAQRLTNRQTLVVEDARFNWRSLARDRVTLIWSNGDDAFGQSLMELAQRSLDRLADDMGVRPPGDVWITVYPTAEDLRGAILHLSEWAGGVALPEYNSVVTGILPGEDDWAAQVIPHELAHLVVGALVFNCLGVGLPTWLDEGLARFSEGLSTDEARAVREALDQNTLPPLRTLANAFPADEARARLAYAQSGQVVQFMIATYGPEKVAALLATVQSGKRVDPALLEVYGFDTDGLDNAYRVSMGAAPLPTAQSISTAAAVERTPVPTLALWTAVPVTQVAAATSAVAATAGVAAVTPTASSPATVEASLAPPTPAPFATAAPESEDNPPRSLWLLLVCAGLVGVLFLVVVGVVLVLIILRRRSSSDGRKT